MVRRKIVKCEVWLKEPMLCRQKDFNYGYIKKVANGDGGELVIVEKDGQSYVWLPFMELRVYAPIVEKFDDLEGEKEKQTGGKSSEKKE